MRVYVIDIENREIKMLKIPGVTNESNLRQGHYALLKVFKDTVVISYTTISTPPQVFSVRFKQIGTEGQTTASLLSDTNLEVNLLEQLDL